MGLIKKLAPLVIVPALVAAFAVPASGVTVPAEVLPDLDQAAPANLQLSSAGAGAWRLGFSSTVMNTGAGPLRIESHDPVPGPTAECVRTCMTADQRVYRDDNSEAVYAAIGKTQWTPGGGHNHWHLQDFEHYLLRPVSGPPTEVKDEKTGFCLVDLIDDHACGLEEPDRTTVTMGLRATLGEDTYGPFLEGQYITLTKASVPTGRYYLEHRANPTGALHEATLANNSASVLLNIAWGSSGTAAPKVVFVRACPDAADCPPQPGDPEPVPPPDPPPNPNPQPQPQPDPQPDNPQPQPAAPPQQLPQTVPVGPPPPVITSSVSARMSRAAALDLARRAIGRATGNKAKQIQRACARESASRYECRVTWTQDGKRWRGYGSVWYRVVSSSLRWYYTLDAAGPKGAHLTRSAARGSISFAAAAPGGASMLCALPPSTI
jgi:hypothetical protein